MEYDTSNPDARGSKSLKFKSRVNVGVDYSFSENIDLSAAFERGSQFRVSFRLKGNFLKIPYLNQDLKMWQG